MRNLFFTLLGAQVALIVLKFFNLSIISWTETFYVAFLMIFIGIIQCIIVLNAVGKYLNYIDEIHQDLY